ncbi:rele toxin of relE/relb toxin-antitoxin system [Caudoviricetes sp.]|nr:rele toxin of relE/relb toxin-antitoxin system [Caudoviricetes sp.]UOF81486.1 rele toxin of relE/relb toxin-antitoxin system [Caudoviricetes sp.]
MQTVCELHWFRNHAQDAGLTEENIDDLVDYIAQNPMCGVEIAGTGGCRKLRFALSNKGKRGGARVVTFYTGEDLPVFILTVFAKGERDNLTKAERNDLAVLTKEIVSEYKNKVVPIRKRRVRK